MLRSKSCGGFRAVSGRQINQKSATLEGRERLGAAVCRTIILRYYGTSPLGPGAPKKGD